MPIYVLVADNDPITANWLKSVLEAEGCVVDTVSASSVALQKIALDLPDLLVLDVVLADGNGLDFVYRLRQDPRTRDLHITILSTQGSPEDIAAGMNAGADDYILKRPGADLELIGKLHAFSAQPKKAAAESNPLRHGKVFSYCSAKGGAGTTSVCLNTAYALAKVEPNAEIVIIDMVFPMGTVGQALGFESQKTVVLLTRENKIDPALVERYVSARTKWGFRLLLGANDPQEATELAVNQIPELFQTLRGMYDYILVDFGRALSRISLPILQDSEGIVLILTPDMSTVKGSKRILDFFTVHGIMLDRVFIINNRTVGRVWTTTEDIERQLAAKVNMTIPYTVEYMSLAINAGVPFMERFPEHAATATFMDIARQLQARVHPKVS